MEMKFITIAVAALASVILGYVWHSKIFENMAQEPNESRMPTAMALLPTYILNFIIAYGLYGYIIELHNHLNSVTEHAFFHGASHGAGKSLFFGVVSVLLITAMLNGKGIKWMLVTVSYWVLTMAMMGGIIGVMG